jgi:hypothetical protein
MMTRRIQVIGVVCAGMMLAAPTVTAAGATTARTAVVGRHSEPRGCAAPRVGQVGCAALLTPRARNLTASAVAASSTPPPGYGPLQLRSAYGLDFSAITGGVGQTVAVVTAYDDATAESDMGIYRSEYGLPACTTANGCFEKVNATGGTSYPPSMTGWSAPTAESLDMISAICPNCHILLVEADTPAIPTTTDPDALGQAENEAAALGAKFIDNTVFTSESTYATQEPTLDSDYFDHPGVAITAPDGAGGYSGPWYPAASPDVIAVGGTTLTAAPATARGWTETAWTGTGSGCSAYETKPAWQTDTGCTDRMANDLSADADNVNSPVAFYDTPSGDWVTGGGNDVSAAIIAAAYALAGAPTAGTNPASYPYAHTTLINDITTGSTGTCTPTYYCTAGTGYDGPTGLGTPATATALGPNAPTTPGTPAPIYDTASKHLEVYLAAGDMFEKSWTPSSGWTNLLNRGGSITGTPAVINDPLSGNLEVYATGTDGTLEEDAWNASNGWSGWSSLGGDITGSPSVVYNPAAKHLEVYARGANGPLFQKYWSPSAGWSGWVNLGGSIAGSPSAIYDTASGHLEVYARGANGPLFQKYWSPSAGWSGWVNLGGSIANSPAAVNDPLSGNLEVYATGTDGSLEQIAWNATSGWSGWLNLGGSITGTPSAIYDTAAKHLEVYVRGANGPLFEKYWSPAAGWSSWVNLGGSTADSPAAVNDPLSGNLEVYATWADGSLEQIAWNSSSGWSGWQNLSGS